MFLRNKISYKVAEGSKKGFRCSFQIEMLKHVKLYYLNIGNSNRINTIYKPYFHIKIIMVSLPFIVH